MNYLIAIGSNIAPRVHVPWVMRRMCEVFRAVRAGRFYRFPPEGMRSSKMFWNGAALIDADASADAVKAMMEAWEIERGRDRSHRDCSLRDRSLDLDLVWGQQEGWIMPIQDVAHAHYIRLPLESLLGGVERRLVVHAVPVSFRVHGRLVGWRPRRLKP